MNRPAIFFDRDNTLIACHGYLGDPAKVVLIPGAASAIAALRTLGFAIVVISNQSGVARGLFDESAMHSVSAQMSQLLLKETPQAIIDAHEFCPHHPQAPLAAYRADCDCRKPKPGMLLKAARELNLDLAQSWLVGDTPRDIDAGAAAGCRTILFTDASLPISPSTCEKGAAIPDFVVNSLDEAVGVIRAHSA